MRYLNGKKINFLKISSIDSIELSKDYFTHYSNFILLNINKLKKNRLTLRITLRATLRTVSFL
jgi:hypothetical protein